MSGSRESRQVAAAFKRFMEKRGLTVGIRPLMKREIDAKKRRKKI